ncbi:MAG: pyridoxamine 5'-phosphate oxidase family protein [Candidatus Bathyarchaeota archaeon]|nr:MAG: pyridoxamine 5'-phosphate oxidase family protein [Candidatus Bathyarchaeota archaeon]
MTGLRRADKEITDRGEVEQVLREAQVGRLGTSVEGRPYVVPLSFVYHEGAIIFHGAGEGKKMAEIARNPRVCFEVDAAELIPSDNPCNFNFRYRSVIANGMAKILEDDPEERLRCLRLLVEKYAPGMGSAMTAERMASFEGLAVVEIAVDEMTGKRSPA